MNSTIAVQNVRKADGRTILQGAESGRAWSIVIDQASGDMSAAMVGSGTSFVLFGVCQRR